MEQSSCTALTPVPANGTRVFLCLEICSRRKVLRVLRSEQHFQLLEHHSMLICCVPAAQACPCFTGREKRGVRVSLTKKTQPREENNSNHCHSQQDGPCRHLKTHKHQPRPQLRATKKDLIIQFSVRHPAQDFWPVAPPPPSQADGKWVSASCGPQDKVKAAHCQKLNGQNDS